MEFLLTDKLLREDLISFNIKNFYRNYLVGGNPATVNGVSVPLQDQWVLTKDEIAEVKTATDAYNVTIQAVAAAKGFGFC